MSRRNPKRNTLTNGCLSFFILKVCVWVEDCWEQIKRQRTEWKQKYNCKCQNKKYRHDRKKTQNHMFLLFTHINIHF
jgi:hypothetical protein